MALVALPTPGAHLLVYGDQTLNVITITPKNGATPTNATTAASAASTAVTGAGGTVSQSGAATIGGESGAALSLTAPTHIGTGVDAIRTSARNQGVQCIAVTGPNTGTPNPAY